MSATPLAELERAVAARTVEGRPFAEALARPGTSLVAEHKRRSPSAGSIREGLSCTELVQAYERGGAAALSVLTEEAHFGGSLDDLREARSATELPILRKDFTVDPYMLLRGQGAGADAVLLVVGALDESELATLYHTARDLDLDAIVEISSDEELEMALAVDADVIGINNRDLDGLHASTSSAPTTCSPTCQRARSWSRSPASHAASRSRSSRASGWTPCWSGETRHARRRSRGRGARTSSAAPRSERLRARLTRPLGAVPYHRDMATAPELDPPAVAELAGRLRGQRGLGGQGPGARVPRRARGASGRGPRADRGQPGCGQDRPGARAGALDRRRVRARPVHRRPAARRRGGHQRLQPARVPFRVPARTRVRQRGAGRRDQPRLAQDAVGAARVHAGAPRDRGQAHPRAGPPVHRAGHPEPDRVRGHLPAPRGAARSLHGARVARLPLARTRADMLAAHCRP